jgi:hypothetical protein
MSRFGLLGQRPRQFDRRAVHGIPLRIAGRQPAEIAPDHPFGHLRQGPGLVVAELSLVIGQHS